MDSGLNSPRWGWLVMGTVALALVGAWVSADAAVPDIRYVACSRN